MTNAIKTVVLTPEMLGLSGFQSPRNKIGSAEDSYAKVPLVFRASRIRCNSLLKIPFHLYRDDGETEAEWPFAYPLRKLIWRTRAAGLLTGAGYVLKQSNRFTVKEVMWLNPTTMRVDWDFTNKRRIFNQTIQGATYGPWTDADMVYIPEFTLRDDIGPGDCPASVALNSAQLSHYVTRMASTFFESGAMPVTLVTSETGFGTDTEKVESFFKRAMQGIANAYRVMAVRGKGVSIEKIQFPLKDLATTELREQARKDVALAFEIPVTLLDDDANYATAKEHKRSFYDETVIPDADVFAEEFNSQLLNPIGLQIEFRPEEMDLYQEDERESAQAAATFTGMLNDIPDYETFEFVAKTYGIEYDEPLAKKVFAAKEKRRAETQAALAPKDDGEDDAEDDEAKPNPPDVIDANKTIKAANTTGVMVALALPVGAATALANEFAGVLANAKEATPPDQMHITLAYFGTVEAVNTTPEILAALLKVFASEHSALNGVVGGKGQFNHVDADGNRAVYASFDSPALPAFQHELIEMLDAAGIEHDKTHGFIPHITLGYVDADTALDDFDVPNLQITFDAMVLAWGGEWFAFPLATGVKTDSISVNAVKALQSDLEKWEKAALKRIKRGGDLGFNSDVIPKTLAAAIHGALEAATTPEDVRGTFANARTWRAYP